MGLFNAAKITAKKNRIINRMAMIAATPCCCLNLFKFLGSPYLPTNSARESKHHTNEHPVDQIENKGREYLRGLESHFIGFISEC